MLIGGFQKFSLIDYPGKISAVVFLSGCNFRCGFCHNPELVEPELIKKQPKIPQKDIFNFLKNRQGKLDGICVTGGEPTIWKDLPQFIAKIKNMGFLVKLDTNGTNPKMVKNLINADLVDYFALDIKNSPEKYGKTVGASVSMQNIMESLKLIAASGVCLELRTTVIPNLIALEDMESIKKWILNLRIAGKVDLYAIQQFRSGKNLKKEYKSITPYKENELRKMVDILKTTIKKVEIRGI